MSVHAWIEGELLFIGHFIEDQNVNLDGVRRRALEPGPDGAPRSVVCHVESDEEGYLVTSILFGGLAVPGICGFNLYVDLMDGIQSVDILSPLPNPGQVVSQPLVLDQLAMCEQA
mgnify:CR=1 FL=1